MVIFHGELLNNQMVRKCPDKIWPYMLQYSDFMTRSDLDVSFGFIQLVWKKDNFSRIDGVSCPRDVPWHIFGMILVGGSLENDARMARFTFYAMAHGRSLPVAPKMQLSSQRSETLFQSHSLYQRVVKSCGFGRIHPLKFTWTNRLRLDPIGYGHRRGEDQPIGSNWEG